MAYKYSLRDLIAAEDNGAALPEKPKLRDLIALEDSRGARNPYNKRVQQEIDTYNQTAKQSGVLAQRYSNKGYVDPQDYTAQRNAAASGAKSWTETYDYLKKSGADVSGLSDISNYYTQLTSYMDKMDMSRYEGVKDERDWFDKRLQQELGAPGKVEAPQTRVPMFNDLIPDDPTGRKFGISGSAGASDVLSGGRKDYGIKSPDTDAETRARNTQRYQAWQQQSKVKEPTFSEVAAYNIRQPGMGMYDMARMSPDELKAAIAQESAGDAPHNKTLARQLSNHLKYTYEPGVPKTTAEAKTVLDATRKALDEQKKIRDTYAMDFYTRENDLIKRKNETSPMDAVNYRKVLFEQAALDKERDDFKTELDQIDADIKDLERAEIDAKRGFAQARVYEKYTPYFQAGYTNDKDITGAYEQEISNAQYLGEWDKMLPGEKLGVWLGDRAYKGALTFNQALYAIPDLIADTLGIDRLSWSNDNKRYLAQIQQNIALQGEKTGWLANAAGDVVTESVRMLPSMLMAVMTGGGSVAGQAAANITTAGSGMAARVTQASISLLKDPRFINSYFNQFGVYLNEARESGKYDDATAVTIAWQKALPNALIEMSGGYEKAAERGRTWLNYLISSLEEGGEELVQGPVERLVDKAYDGIFNMTVDEFISLTNKDAVLSGVTGLQEFGMGFATSLFVGGVQTGANVAIDKASWSFDKFSVKNNYQAALLDMAEFSKRFAPEHPYSQWSQYISAEDPAAATAIYAALEMDALNADPGTDEQVQAKRNAEDFLNIYKKLQLSGTQFAAMQKPRPKVGEEPETDPVTEAFDFQEYFARANPAAQPIVPEVAAAEPQGQSASVIPDTAENNDIDWGDYWKKIDAEQDAQAAAAPAPVIPAITEQEAPAPIIPAMAKTIKETAEQIALSPEAAEQLKTDFDASKLDEATFSDAYTRAYQAGLEGIDPAYLTSSTAVAKLSPDLAKTAYDLGTKNFASEMRGQKMEAAAAAKMTKLKPGEGGVTYHASVDKAKLRPYQQNQINIWDTVAKVLGLNAVMFQSATDAEGNIIAGAEFGMENGKYEYSTGRIWIDVNAQKKNVKDSVQAIILKTAGHEVTHFIKHLSPVLYREYSRAVTQALANAGQDLDTLIDEQIARSAKGSAGEIDFGISLEEVIANQSDLMLRDSKVITDLQEKSPDLFNRIREWLVDFSKRVRDAFERFRGTESASQKAIMQDVEGALRYTDELIAKFDIALGDAAGIAPAAPSGGEVSAPATVTMTMPSVQETAKEVAAPSTLSIIREGIADAKAKEDAGVRFQERDAGLRQNDDGTVTITDAEKIDTEVWGKIAKGVKRLGYDIRDAEDAKERYSRAGIKKLNPDVSQVIKSVLGIAEDEAQPVDSQMADTHRKTAIKEFGYTPYFYDAGYILPNGNMLNFSGEKGKHYNSRGQDHRAIGVVFEEDLDSATAGMNAFIAEGNIRIMDETPGIDLSADVKPTAKQLKTIKEHVDASRAREYYAIDFSRKDGYSAGKYEYENGANPTRVMADIDYFYKNGETREPSLTSQFRYQDRTFAPPTYSKMERAIEDVFRNKSISKVDWRSLYPYLKKNGVTADEMRWSGISTIFKIDNPKTMFDVKSFTKAELLEFARGNALKVEDVSKGSSPESAKLSEVRTKRSNEYTEISGDTWRSMRNLIRKDPYYSGVSDAEKSSAIDAFREDFENMVLMNGTAYKDGFSNKRLGNIFEQLPADGVRQTELALQRYFVARDAYRDAQGDDKFSQYALKGGRNYREILFTAPDLDGTFQSAHWDEKNVLAHTRMQDFTTKDGKPVLFIEEVQSDWHEKGREEGYAKPVNVVIGEYKSQGKEGYPDIAQVHDDNENLIGYIMPMHGKYVADARNGRRIGAYETEKQALDALAENEKYRFSEVPEAPFTTTWHEYVLKRALRMAAEGDYDYMAWTTGEMQADRYSLAKQVSAINAYQNGGERAGTYNIDVLDSDGFPLLGFTNSKMSRAEVINTFGKDLGARLIEGADNKQGGRFQVAEEGLKVGGEGMKNFYDIGGKSSQNIPRFLNKYGAQWGAGISTIEIQGDKTYSVPAIEINERMKESVLYEGQVLYQERDSTGAQLTAEQAEFFRDSKVRDAQGRLLKVYHGTDEDFTVFEEQNSEDRLGFYFTSRPDAAYTYASEKGFEGIRESYLNIRNPLVIDAQGARWDNINPGGNDKRYTVLQATGKGPMDYMRGRYEVESIIIEHQAVGENDITEKRFDDTEDAEKYVLEMFGQDVYDELIAPLYQGEQHTSLSNQLLDELYEGKSSDRPEGYSTRQIVSVAINDGEHDGVIIKNVIDINAGMLGTVKLQGGSLSDVYVAFSPEQIKSTTNLAPTSDPDIRFQERTDDPSSAREILSTGFEAIAANDAERSLLKTYQGRVKELNAMEQAVTDYRTQIQAIESAIGFDPKAPNDRLIRLKNNVKTLTGKINRADKKLLTFEKAAPLKAVLDREVKKVQKKQAEIRRTQRKDLLAQHRSDTKAKVTAAKEKGKEKLSDYKTGQQSTHYKDRIKALSLELGEWIVNPTGKKYVPEVLRTTIGDFLLSINEESRRILKGGDSTIADRAFFDRLSSLRDTIQRLRTKQQSESGEVVNDVYESLNGYLDLPDNFIDKMTAIVDNTRKMTMDAAGNHVLNRMDLEQLKSLDEVMRTLSASVKTINKFLVNKHFEGVDKAGAGTIMDMSGMASKLTRTGTMDRFLNWDNIEPYYAFERMGDAGRSIFEGLILGQDRMAKISKEIVDFAVKTFTPEEAREWGKQVHTFTLNGQPLQMTTTHIMALYALNNRKQARGHIYGGGIRVSDFKVGKTRYADAGHVISETGVDKIIGTLTPRQLDVAKKLQVFMAQRGSALGNQVSLARFGVDLFGAEGDTYFPIESVRENMDETMDAPEGNPLYRLLNLSMTKGLTKGANNQILVHNIFDVFAAHMSDMAQYNSLALPILDAVKWYNFRQSYKASNGQKHVDSVKGSIRNAFGSPALGYITQLLKDINGARVTTGGEGMLMAAVRHYNRSAVAANLRVALLQPTSIVRALNVIDAKYLSAGSIKNLAKMRQNIKEMEKYSGIALWKQMGFYDVNLSRSLQSMIKRDDPLFDRITEKTMAFPQAMDRITWAAIWEGAKLQVAAENKWLGQSTPAFFEKVQALFDRAIYATQVVDSMLTRSDYMRKTTFGPKWTSSFMSEPTKTYNILANMVHKYNDTIASGATRGKAWQQHGSMITRGVAVYAASAALVTMVEALASAWRDDDEYKTFWEKLMAASKENLIDNLMPLNLPIINDLWQLFKNKLGPIIGPAIGVDIWGFEDTSPLTQGLSLLSDGVTGVINRLSGKESKMTDYGIAYKLLQGISAVTGHPMSSATREVVDLWNNTVGVMYPQYKVKRYDASSAGGFDALWESIEAGDTERTTQLRSILDSKGQTEKGIMSGLQTRARAAYQEGKLTQKRAMDLLSAQPGAVKDDVYWLTRKWEDQRARNDWSSENYSKYDKYMTAITTGKDLRKYMDELLTHGGSKDAIATAIKNEFKPIYLDMPVKDRTELKGRLLNAYTMLGYDRDDRAKAIDKWLKP